jgi:hypothetical protein
MPGLIQIKHNLPAKLFLDADIKNAINNAAQKGAERVVKKLKAVVENWENQPQFTAHKTSTGWAVKYDARTIGGKEFTFVSEGTKAHHIPPPLTFRWGGYGSTKAKTQVGSLKSYKGMSAKNAPNLPWVHIVNGVNHPGIWPRSFAQLIMKEEKDSIMRDLKREVDKLPVHGMQGPKMELM